MISLTVRWKWPLVFSLPFYYLLLLILTITSDLSGGGVMGYDSSSSRAGERYSYSLTTFDPSGKLGQVERAMLAAEQGTPIVCLAIAKNSDSSKMEVILAAPQFLPSPFMLDDGTPRFVKITSSMVVGHSGLSADGRVLLDAARRLAIEHEYTFDEEVDVDIFLEEMSLLFQSYTMKPGVRLFGASLVVAYIPPPLDASSSAQAPQLYRLDPSGHVEMLGKVAVVHGGGLERMTDLIPQLDKIVKKNKSDTEEDVDESVQVPPTSAAKNTTTTTTTRVVVKKLRESLRQLAKKKGRDMDYEDDMTIVTATLSRGGVSDSDPPQLQVDRYEPDDDVSS